MYEVAAPGSNDLVPELVQEQTTSDSEAGIVKLRKNLVSIQREVH